MSEAQSDRDFGLSAVPPPTERLVFRVWSSDDEELAVQLWGDPEVARHILARTPTREEVLERLAKEIETQREHGIQYWPIFLHDKTHVGCCGLRPYREGVLELGAHVRPAFWRKGFALEAARAAIAYAFRMPHVTALFAGHNPKNDASRAMLLKLGFRHAHDEIYPPTGLMHPSYLLARVKAPSGSPSSR